MSRHGRDKAGNQGDAHMNARVDASGFLRRGGTAGTNSTSVWLHAIGATLALAIIAGALLPGALILPAISVGSFAISLASSLVAAFRGEAECETASLVAAVFAFLGIAAAVLSDPDRIVAYMR